MSFLVPSAGRIRLKGDSIARGFAFGNYVEPSPLRSIHGMARILLEDNLAHPPEFDALPWIWEGLNEDGTPKTVDTMADEIRIYHSDGRLKQGDWLVFEEAGETDKTVHPAPWPWPGNVYVLLRKSFRDMVLAAEPIVGRDRIVFMTMFDYTDNPQCQWDRLLDDGIHTGNDALRDEAASLRVKLIDMNLIMDAAQDYLQSNGWGGAVGPDQIHPNVYGNFVMLVSILDGLGADVSDWRLDGLYRHFKHPESGGDVQEVWGFRKDPSDYERLVILHELRDMVMGVVHPDRTCKRHPGIKRVLLHGRVLSHPNLKPEGTRRPVSYELGHIFQIDEDRCMLVASLREQGGHDFCVGNDAFVFGRLSDIAPEKAIPINRPDPIHQLRSGAGAGVQSKGPACGAFVPLGARLDDGRSHPAAGTGFLISRGITFLPDRSEIHPEADSTYDLIQLQWDGDRLHIESQRLPETLLGMSIIGSPLTDCCAQGETFLCPFTVAGRGHAVFRFEWNGSHWFPTEHGEPFPFRKPHLNESARTVHDLCVRGEFEPSLQRCEEGYYVYTRGADPHGRLYRSKEGSVFEQVAVIPNHTVPQVLNLGLDGSMYVATNTGPGWLRNPLLAFPIHENTFGEPITIHDHKGIRSDGESEVPFVDHGVAGNVWLEGRYRHLLCYRVCDLRETNGEGAPPTAQTGLYVAEIEFSR